MAWEIPGRTSAEIARRVDVAFFSRRGLVALQRHGDHDRVDHGGQHVRSEKRGAHESDGIYQPLGGPLRHLDGWKRGTPRGVRSNTRGVGRATAPARPPRRTRPRPRPMRPQARWTATAAERVATAERRAAAGEYLGADICGSRRADVAFFFRRGLVARNHFGQSHFIPQPPDAL